MKGWFASRPKSPRGRESSLEQLLQTSPTFPGIPLHVCTEDVSRDELEKVRIPFPVHIRDTSLSVGIFYIIFKPTNRNVLHKIEKKQIHE